MVAGELEARWNQALARVAEVEARVATHDAAAPRQPDVPTISFSALADDLKAIWTAPTTDARLKKRIVRTVIREAMADLDEVAAEIVIVIHWIGGVHTEHRLPRRRRGQRNSTPADIVEAVRTLALIARDDVLAGILNRNGLRTGNGNRWTRERVTSLRSSYDIPVHRPAEDGIEPWLNLSSAATLIGVAPRTLRIAVEQGDINALHPLGAGPWVFKREDLDGPAALRLASRVQSSPRHPTVSDTNQQSLFASTT